MSKTKKDQIENNQSFLRENGFVEHSESVDFVKKLTGTVFYFATPCKGMIVHRLKLRHNGERIYPNLGRVKNRENSLILISKIENHANFFSFLFRFLMEHFNCAELKTIQRGFLKKNKNISYIFLHSSNKDIFTQESLEIRFRRLNDESGLPVELLLNKNMEESELVEKLTKIINDLLLKEEQTISLV